MERDIWKALEARLAALGDRRPVRCEFTDAEIVRVYLWSVLHDRPVCWACQRMVWPGRPRKLPTPSTMTRRLRTISVMTLMRRLIPKNSDARLMYVDGKPLRVSRFSKDKQAKRGYGAGGFDRGYKLHLACTRRGKIQAFDVRPMNEAECVVARRLISRTVKHGSVVIADASYDSNPLYQVTASHGARLIAPRRKKHRSVSRGHNQHPDRLKSIDLLENSDRKRRQVSRLRTAIERLFGWLTLQGGGHLPPWVRTLPRVRRWVIAKISIHAVAAAV